ALYACLSLSLHDALPICLAVDSFSDRCSRDGEIAAVGAREHDWRGSRKPPNHSAPTVTSCKTRPQRKDTLHEGGRREDARSRTRSEEHTSELQSLAYLVC